MSVDLLVVNPGSTTTKVAWFEDDIALLDEELQHPRDLLASFGGTPSQEQFRRESVIEAVRPLLDEGRIPDIVVGRGGLLRPMKGGVYSISDRMIEDLLSARYGDHPCNLGAVIARNLARQWDVSSCIVDPVVTDELDEEARLTGFPEISRRSVFHALSQRGAARKVAMLIGRKYDEGKFLVAHMGGGISVGAHRRGRIADVTNALDGEGPFSPERSGSLPILPVLNLIEEGVYTFDEIRRRVTSGSGLVAHLGTNDLREVQRMMDEGDFDAEKVFKALVYNVSKQLSSLAPVLMSGDDAKAPIDAVVLTGGMARSARLVDEISDRISFLAPVTAVTGLEEMEVMAQGGLMLLRNEVEVQEYL